MQLYSTTRDSLWHLLGELPARLVPAASPFALDCCHGEGMWWQSVLDFGPYWETCVIEAHARSSQFDRLIRATGLDGGVVALARLGDGFYGQNGRCWETLDGNLFFCASMPVACGAGMELLRFVPCLAVCDAIMAVVPQANPGTKWVNDVFCLDAKLAGCLSSLRACREGMRFVVGIGLNIVRAPVLGSEAPATACLAAFDGLWRHDSARCAAIVRALCGALENWLVQWRRDPEAIWRGYLERQCCLNREVRLQSDVPPHDVLAQGVLRHIDRDFRLWVDGKAYANARCCFSREASFP
ncbi:MAG: hypothetical protein FWC40_09360 [Proteobacteria bacterium]|nr:hypothetical protein [Pseudomonadota bacterium]